MVRAARRTALAWLVPLAFAGCAGWQGVQLSPATFNPPPAELRVTRLDGWQAVITAPRFERDTIRGVRASEPYDSIVMPAASVRSVAVPAEDHKALGTVGALAGFLAVFVGLWCLALCGGYQT